MLLQIEEFHSFLWLSNSPLCVCVCMCVCLYIYTHTYIYVYHILFIHLSVDGHLSYFFILTILHSAATNLGLHVSFWISVFFFSKYVAGSGIAGSLVVLFLVFWGTSILFSKVATPIYIPTNSVWMFPFLHILSNICYL